MAEIGILGMGKLGAPVAYTFAMRGHDVMGYDVNSDTMDNLRKGKHPFQEDGLPELIENHSVKLAKSMGELVGHSEMIFAAIQTPHLPKYEGTTKLPETRADFDYRHLKAAVGQVVIESVRQNKNIDLVIISTVLPGTIDREVKPILNDRTHLVYEPMFIAMGTVIKDVLHPEFTLIGVDEPDVADRLEAFHKTIHTAPALKTDIVTAEAIKVSYNTWITAKTVIANIWGEIAEKTGANFEDIYKAWGLSTDRLISTKYMHTGMGDGGGCHPRDNIALSWLAKEIGLSHNIFDDLMRAREDFEDYHARQAIQASKESGLPLIILGRSFKPETNIEIGSAAILMANLARNYGYPFGHFEDLEEYPKAVYFIATNHERYKDIDFPEGSVVINPFLV